jgi:hypothetical protein
MALFIVSSLAMECSIPTTPIGRQFTPPFDIGHKKERRKRRISRVIKPIGSLDGENSVAEQDTNGRADFL